MERNMDLPYISSVVWKILGERKRYVKGIRGVDES